MILREGKIFDRRSPEEWTLQALKNALMSSHKRAAPPAAAKDSGLSVLVLAWADLDGNPVTLNVRKGEVVGVTGYAPSGAPELLRRAMA